MITEIDELDKETHYQYDLWGNLVLMIDRNGNETHYEYDPLNRLIKTTDPQGYVEINEYDGNDNIVKLIDENGAITNFDYNELNQNIKIYGDTGNVGSSCGCTGGTSANGKEGDYIYNWRGDVLAFVDVKGLLTEYHYDERYRKIAEIVDPMA